MTRVQLSTPYTSLINDLCDVIRLFYGEIELVDDEAAALHVRHEQGESGHLMDVNGTEFSVPLPSKGGDALEEKRLLKRAVKHCLYEALKKHTDMHPPWGSLTGIRPTRLFHEQMALGRDGDAAVFGLMQSFDLQKDKALLLKEIYAQQRLIEQPGNSEMDVYIGIPFCKTRCSYCSFAAMDLAHGAKLTEPYVDALTSEMKACAEDFKGYSIRSLYIGGGTPTALSCDQLERLIDTALDIYPCKGEFTVEAGRPDTIDKKMLQMLKKKGVNRLSINPQTMNDQTLARIGRLHTAQQIKDAFYLARDAGFDLINMDLILALPGEGLQDVQRTLDEIEALSPENLTVHTLAIKRASRMREEGEVQALEGEAQAMVNLTRQRAAQMGLAPYYLYRQKYMAGNLENVGYCKEGAGCIYNMDIMEEIAPILAFGAGAISKWLYDEKQRIERAPNVKNIEQYIDRVGEMAQRKKALLRH